MLIGLVKCGNNLSVEILILDHTCIPSFLNLLIKSNLLHSKKISCTFTKILFVLFDQLFKLLKCLAVTDSFVNLVADLGNFGTHRIEKSSALLKKEVFDIGVIDLCNVTKAILVPLIEAVKFRLDFTGHQGCKHVVLVEFEGFELRLTTFSHLLLKKTLVAHQ